MPPSAPGAELGAATLTGMLAGTELAGTTLAGTMELGPVESGMLRRSSAST